MIRIIIIGVLFLIAFQYSYAYEQWTTAGVGRPELNRRAIAGVWKLTPNVVTQFPMKEFTVYPKKSIQSIGENRRRPGLLLMLNEDGSFRQYSGNSLDDVEDDNVDVDQSWSTFQTHRKSVNENIKLRAFMKGIWDFRDGTLILAADRPEQQPNRKVTDLERQNAVSTSIQALEGDGRTHDTLLTGRVVASYRMSLQENPALVSSSPMNNITTTTTALDTHLSVPKGSINIGKFFYPKQHPSFFEQPMFHPINQGTATLQQILGSLNTEVDPIENDVVEKFQRSDLYNKTFLLTSHPIGVRQPSGTTRWSIKYNKVVHDPPNSRNTKSGDGSTNIRVVEVAFHANNTFSTTAGLGGSAILRGRFDVVGVEKDHLWMQVVRFGFGRSVSGSVYSEGRMLSHEDAKAYWGKIQRMNTSPSSSLDTLSINEGTSPTDAANPINDVEEQRLEVQGSVLDGWGLEPIPVAQFVMKEVSVDREIYEEEDEDDDDKCFVNEAILRLEPGLDNEGIDWTERSEGSFQ